MRSLSRTVSTWTKSTARIPRLEQPRNWRHVGPATTQYICADRVLHGFLQDAPHRDRILSLVAEPGHFPPVTRRVAPQRVVAALRSTSVLIGSQGRLAVAGGPKRRVSATFPRRSCGATQSVPGVAGKPGLTDAGNHTVDRREPSRSCAVADLLFNMPAQHTAFFSWAQGPANSGVARNPPPNRGGGGSRQREVSTTENLAVEPVRAKDISIPPCCQLQR